MIYIILVIFSIFLGPRLFAISTPVAQVSIYRALILSLPLVLIFSYHQQNSRLKLPPAGVGRFNLQVYAFWWLWAFMSIMWVTDYKLWFQSVFLMTLGFWCVIAINLWTKSDRQWMTLVRVAWFSMSLQVLWGYYEILTNRYLYADMSKLDRYSTFTSNPSSRIPITYFANQNDYAVLMLAYLALVSVLWYQARWWWQKGLYFGSGLAAGYLIYRSGSRMALLMLLVYLALTLFNHIKIYPSRIIGWKLFGYALVGIGGFWLLKPSLLTTLINLILSKQYNRPLSGDMGRINLYKNGFIALVETWGRGLGAGNIETWMGSQAYFNVGPLVNIHNWWLEILVGYGLICFFLYVLAYGMLMRHLWRMRQSKEMHTKRTAQILFNFLLIFILAAMTSANNMLIEWHWAVMGLVISYVSIHETLGKTEDK